MNLHGARSGKTQRSPQQYKYRGASHITTAEEPAAVKLQGAGDHRPSLNGKATLSVQLFKLYGTAVKCHKRFGGLRRI